MSWFNYDVRCPECGGKGNSDCPSHWCDDCNKKCEEWLDRHDPFWRNE